MVPPFLLSLKPSQVTWIFSGAAVVVGAIVMVALLHGQQSTNCDGLVVKTTVLDLVKKKSSLPSNTDYELDSIRKTGGDPANGNISCEAKVFGEFNNVPYSSAPLTYTVTRQADGQVMVRVEGITGLHFP